LAHEPRYAIQSERALNGALSLTRYFTELYLPYIRSYKKTFDHDRYTYFKNLHPFFGSFTLNEISARDVDRWIAEQSAQGYANSTIIKHLVLLKRMMRVAVRWELIANDNAVNNHRKIRLGICVKDSLPPKKSPR